MLGLKLISHEIFARWVNFKILRNPQVGRGHRTQHQTNNSLFKSKVIQFNIK